MEQDQISIDAIGCTVGMFLLSVHSESMKYHKQLVRSSELTKANIVIVSSTAPLQ